MECRPTRLPQLAQGHAQMGIQAPGHQIGKRIRERHIPPLRRTPTKAQQIDRVLLQRILVYRQTAIPAVLISNPRKAAVGVGWRTRIGRLGR